MTLSGHLIGSRINPPLRLSGSITVYFLTVQWSFSLLPIIVHWPFYDIVGGKLAWFLFRDLRRPRDTEQQSYVISTNALWGSTAVWLRTTSIREDGVCVCVRACACVSMCMLAVDEKGIGVENYFLWIQDLDESSGSETNIYYFISRRVRVLAVLKEALKITNNISGLFIWLSNTDKSIQTQY